MAFPRFRLIEIDLTLVLCEPPPLLRLVNRYQDSDCVLRGGEFRKGNSVEEFALLTTGVVQRLCHPIELLHSHVLRALTRARWPRRIETDDAPTSREIVRHPLNRYDLSNCVVSNSPHPLKKGLQDPLAGRYNKADPNVICCSGCHLPYSLIPPNARISPLRYESRNLEMRRERGV